jgi:cytochrome c2
VLAVAALCFGAAFTWLFFGPEVTRSRGMSIVAAGVGISLGVLPFLRTGRSLVAGTALAAVLAAGLFAPRQPAIKGDQATTVELATSLAYISIRYHRGVVETKRSNRGGAVAALDDGVLVATAEGVFHRIDWDSTAAQLAVTRLDIRSPLNSDEFLGDMPAQPPPYATAPPYFRVTGLVLDSAASVPGRMYVAHHHWNTRDRCMALRVSTAMLDASGAATPWQTVFETRPCLPLSEEYKQNETGGRLAWYRGRLLLSTGDNGFHGEHALSQDPSGDYGKILLLDAEGGREVVSMGHRNPQGLMVDDEGRIWSTEHGPSGGDEINVIVPGGNYCWPSVTYGTEYGQRTWTHGAKEHSNATFIEPAMAFVPSPAVTSMLEVTRGPFPEWHGDLLIGSLGTKDLLRARIQDDKVRYVEHIPIGNRIRDLVQARDGRIVMWTDEGDIVMVSPAEKPLGERVYERCAGCHGLTLDGTGLGPRVRGLQGRVVASVEGYAYSPALKKLGGTWVAERLTRFLRDPQAFAPGTTMQFEGLTDAREIEALIAYLWRNY